MKPIKIQPNKNKNRKQRKQLSPEARFNLKVGFGSLFSNNSAIEAGKSLPFWIPIILGLLGAFLAILPIMVGILNTNGEALIKSSNTYAFEREYALALYNLNEQGIEFTVGEGHLLTYTKNGKTITPTSENDFLLYRHQIDSTGQYEGTSYSYYGIEAYYLFDKEEYPAGEKTSSQWYTEYNNVSYKLHSIDKKADTDPSGTKYYKPHRIYFYKTGVAISLVKNDSDVAFYNFTGELVNVTPGKLIERFIAGTVLAEHKDPNTLKTEELRALEKQLFENIRPFLNDSYSSIKSRTLLYSVSIYYSIYVGLIIFLGLLMFLLTRGKKNFNNYLRIHQTLRIAGWASFTPGLLALILGFFMPNYAMMFFILFLGVRVMWMSMKQLSPNYTPRG